MPDRGTGDLERDLMSNEEYAITAVFSCAFLCSVLVITVVLVAALVRWL